MYRDKIYLLKLYVINALVNHFCYFSKINHFHRALVSWCLLPIKMLPFCVKIVGYNLSINVKSLAFEIFAMWRNNESFIGYKRNRADIHVYMRISVFIDTLIYKANGIWTLFPRNYECIFNICITAFFICSFVF